MVDESLIFKIRQLRARGKTYNECAEALHVSFSTISRALKAGAAREERATTLPASPSGGGSSYIWNNVPMNGDALCDLENNAVGGSSCSDIHIDGERTKLVADRQGLRMVSIDNPDRSSNSQLIYAPLPSWFWKLFFISIGIVMFIRILKRTREDVFGDN
jgi:hypothetical protein